LQEGTAGTTGGIFFHRHDITSTDGSHIARRLDTSYHVPRFLRFLFACNFLLESICMSQGCFLRLRKKDSEEKEKKGRNSAAHHELTSLYAID